MEESRGSSAHISSWLEVLDDLTYYELLGIPQNAPDDQVQAAFHRFCDEFHPDRHVGRAAEDRSAILSIFRRATEAHLVLRDRALRAQYDAQLRARMPSQQPARISQPARRSAAAPDPGASPLEHAARSPSSRPFARRADELLASGDLRHAKLQLVMANHHDPDNPALQDALRELEAKLAAPR